VIERSSVSHSESGFWLIIAWGRPHRRGRHYTSAALCSQSGDMVLFGIEQRNDLRTAKYLWPFLCFLNEDIPVWPKICSIHLIIRHTKPDKKNSTSFISISGSKCGGVGTNLKISYSMIDSSAVWKAIAVRFLFLDRACRAAHCANIGFSIPDYSPVLHRLECPAQRWTLTDGAVLVLPSGEHIGKTQCGDALSTQPLALLYTTNCRADPAYVLSGFHKNVNGTFFWCLSKHYSRESI
jgi:hypothetical protein